MLLLALLACRATAPVDLGSLRAAADAEYRAGDHAGFVATMERLVAAEPEGWGNRYDLACGYALAGRPDDALAQLRALLDHGVDYGAAADHDFDSLHGTTGWDAFVAELDARFPVVSTGVERFRVTDPHLDPEGIAWDPATGRTFLSSMATGRVVVVAPDGAVSDFARVDADVPLGTLGLVVDAPRGLLWAVAGAFEEVDGYRPEHLGETGLYAFDLATGEPRRAVRRPTPDPRGGFNDVALAADGRLYATGFGALTVVDPERGTVETLALDPPLDFANGIALADGVAWLGTPWGVARVDLATRKRAWVEAPPHERLNSFDGLYLRDGHLVGVELGGRWRVVDVALDPAGARALAVTVLEQGTPTLFRPTTGALVGDAVDVVARTRGEDGAAVPVVVRVPLPRGD